MTDKVVDIVIFVVIGVPIIVLLWSLTIRVVVETIDYIKELFE